MVYPHPYPLHILIFNMLDILKKGLSPFFQEIDSFVNQNFLRTSTCDDLFFQFTIDNLSMTFSRFQIPETLFLKHCNWLRL